MVLEPSDGSHEMYRKLTGKLDTGFMSAITLLIKEANKFPFE